MTPETELTSLFRILPQQKTGLKKLGINTVNDMLYHLPSRYSEQTNSKTIAGLTKGEKVTIYGRVLSQETKKAWRKKIPMAEMTIEDASGKIKAVWFHQAYMAKKFTVGSYVQATGVVSERKGSLYLANPILEDTGELKNSQEVLPIGDSGETPIIPVYAETRGVSSLWIFTHVSKIIKNLNNLNIDDPIPDRVREKYNLPILKTAIVWAHMPSKLSDAEVARKRFAFEEIFKIQIQRLKTKAEYKVNKSFTIEPNKNDIKDFISRFPFKATNAQVNAINTILNDLSKNEPMTRLLEGDVGSGKTAVAATVAHSIATTHPGGKDFGNLQVAYMAPTEILARQHFESFIQYFKHLNIQIGLITGSECRKFPSKISPGGHTHISRTQLLKWVANGEIPILIGTHAIIQKSVHFKHLALAIVDEQHRFGTMQRAGLTKKGLLVPHLLTMTATPIPRTLALTIFGDLDLSLLDELPAGRKPIITEVVAKNERARIYKHIEDEIKNGRQVYIICPRIDEPDPDKEMALQIKSAVAERDRLQNEVFPKLNIGLVHSKINPKEKERVMQEFTNGKINILVATSVVEVGVNIPNATIIVIEGAERFGLAQLHQLRGRVLRSSHQAHCYLFTSDNTKGVPERLKAILKAKNGFELAEMDLKLRGFGELSGIRQWGISDAGMEALRNLKLVEAARTEAKIILEQDPKLENHPLLAKILLPQEKHVHLE